MRSLQRLEIPALLFVNKIDRAGAGKERVLRAIAARLSPAVVPMGSASGLGTRAAGFTPWGEANAGARARKLSTSSLSARPLSARPLSALSKIVLPRVRTLLG